MKSRLLTAATIIISCLLMYIHTWQRQGSRTLLIELHSCRLKRDPSNRTENFWRSLIQPKLPVLFGKEALLNFILLSQC